MPQTQKDQRASTRSRGIVEVRRTRALFEAFYDRYDALIALLCIAAREGVSSDHERQYRERRTWFLRNYRRVEPHVISSLEANDADCYFKGAERNSCDAFQALFMPQTIAFMFENDGGALIERMMRTQFALGEWDANVASMEAECRLNVAASEFRQSPLPAF